MRCGAEALPVRIGRHAEMPLEDPPQGLGAAEPAARRHHVEGVAGLLERAAGGLQAGALDEAARGLADLGGEDPAKCRTLMAAAAARTGIRWSPPGAVSTRVCTARIVERSARGTHTGGRELGLPSGAMEEHDEPAGNGLGHVDAEVLLDQCQCKVDAGGDPCAGPVLPSRM